MKVATGSCAPGGSSGKVRTLPGPSCQVGCRDSGAPGRMCGERRDGAIRASGASANVRSQAPPHDCHPERNARRAWRRRISCVPDSLSRAPKILRLRCCAPALRMTTFVGGGNRTPVATQCHRVPCPRAQSRGRLHRRNAKPNAPCHPERNARRAWSRRISWMRDSLPRAPEILRRHALRAFRSG